MRERGAIKAEREREEGGGGNDGVKFPGYAVHRGRDIIPQFGFYALINYRRTVLKIAPAL